MGAFTLLSDYANDDTNIQNMQQTLTASFKNGMSISLTEMDSETIPAIEEGSWVEDNGSLYYANDGDVGITDNDPVTDAQVADGTVYICLVPDIDSSGGILEAAFTASEPSWSGSKQGWYLTNAGFENYRVVSSAFKKADSYKYKKIIRDRMDSLYDVSFFAYLNSTGIEDEETIIYDVVDHDKHENYNSSTGVFTAPFDGVYYFSASASGTSSSAGDMFNIRKGGSAYIAGYSNVATVVEAQASCIIELDKNDTIDVYTTALFSSVGYGTTKRTSFYGYLIK